MLRNFVVLTLLVLSSADSCYPGYATELNGGQSEFALAIPVGPSLTIDLWVLLYTSPAPAVQLVVQDDDFSSGQRETTMLWAVDDLGGFLYGHRMRNGTMFLTHIGDASPAAETGRWHHQALARDASQRRITIFVDGIPVGVKSYGADADPTVPTATALRMGGNPMGFAPPAHLVVAELRVWNETRSMEQIYFGMYSVPQQERMLAGYWPLNNSTANATTAQDLSSARTPGRLTNATVSSDCIYDLWQAITQPCAPSVSPLLGSPGSTVVVTAPATPWALQRGVTCLFDATANPADVVHTYGNPCALATCIVPLLPSGTLNLSLVGPLPTPPTAPLPLLSFQVTAALTSASPSNTASLSASPSAGTVTTSPGLVDAIIVAPPPSNRASPLVIGLAAGGGGAALFVILVIVVCCILRRNNKRRVKSNVEQGQRNDAFTEDFSPASPHGGRSRPHKSVLRGSDSDSSLYRPNARDFMAHMDAAHGGALNDTLGNDDHSGAHMFSSGNGDHEPDFDHSSPNIPQPPPRLKTPPLAPRAAMEGSANTLTVAAVSVPSMWSDTQAQLDEAWERSNRSDSSDASGARPAPKGALPVRNSPGKNPRTPPTANVRRAGDDLGESRSASREETPWSGVRAESLSPGEAFANFPLPGARSGLPPTPSLGPALTGAAAISDYVAFTPQRPRSAASPGAPRFTHHESLNTMSTAGLSSSATRPLSASAARLAAHNSDSTLFSTYTYLPSESRTVPGDVVAVPSQRSPSHAQAVDETDPLRLVPASQGPPRAAPGVTRTPSGTMVAAPGADAARRPQTSDARVRSAPAAGPKMVGTGGSRNGGKDAPPGKPPPPAAKRAPGDSGPVADKARVKKFGAPVPQSQGSSRAGDKPDSKPDKQEKQPPGKKTTTPATAAREATAPAPARANDDRGRTSDVRMSVVVPAPDKDGKGGTPSSSRTGSVTTKTTGSHRTHGSSSEFRKKFPSKPMYTRIRSLYNLIRRIYTGSDTAVFTATSKRGGTETSVVKFILDEKYSDQQAPKEVEMLSALQGHPCIPPLNEWFTFDRPKSYALVIPYYYNTRVRISQPNLLRKYVWDVLQTLRWCRIRSILYRDVKPGNIIFDKRLQRAMLVDYDCATYYNPNQEPTGNYGTDGYMAPEIADKERRAKGYGFPVDIFSAGVLFFEKAFDITGKEEGEQSLQKINAMLARVKEPSPLIDLVSQMVRADPQDRISVTDALRHPYFVPHCTTPPFLESVYPPQS